MFLYLVYECVTNPIDRDTVLDERCFSVEPALQWPGMAPRSTGWFYWDRVICFCADCACMGSLGTSVSLERRCTVLPSRGIVIAHRLLVLGGTSIPPAHFTSIVY